MQKMYQSQYQKENNTSLFIIQQFINVRSVEKKAPFCFCHTTKKINGIQWSVVICHSRYHIGKEFLVRTATERSIFSNLTEES